MAETKEKKITKTKENETTEEQQVKAVGRYIRVSPFKIRPIVDSIKGKSVEEAEGILKFSPKGVAKYVLQVLNSATANARQSEKLKAKPEELSVSKAFVDEGPTLKRVEFRAMGRANRIRKRTSHVTVILSKKEIQRQEEVRGSKG